MLTALWKEHARREEIHDERFARVVWINAEINRDRKARSKPFTPRDFMLGGKPRKYASTPEEAVLLFQQSSEEGLNEMLNFTALQNARLKG